MNKHYLVSRSIPRTLVKELLDSKLLAEVKDKIAQLVDHMQDTNMALNFAQRDVFLLRAREADLQAENEFLIQQMAGGGLVI